jgi:hypothetical protein
MKKEVSIHRDDLIEMLKFSDKYPQSDYLTISVDSSSGIGSIVDVSLNTVVNGDVVTITKHIVDETSW